MSIKQKINYFFDWKSNPASVFFLVIPLAVIGFGLNFALAFMHFKLNNNPWYLVIFAVGIALLVICLWPIRKQLMRIVRQN